MQAAVLSLPLRLPPSSPGGRGGPAAPGRRGKTRRLTRRAGKPVVFTLVERDGRDCSNTVEGFFSLLKRGVVGTFHHISEAHLARSLAEFDFRYSNRVALGITHTMRADELLRGIGGKRLTYRRTGEAAHT